MHWRGGGLAGMMMYDVLCMMYDYDDDEDDDDDNRNDHDDGIGINVFVCVSKGVCVHVIALSEYPQSFPKNHDW